VEKQMIAVDFLIDIFLIFFPISLVSSRMRLKPNRLSDLAPALERLGLRRVAIKEFAKHTVLLLAALVAVGIVLSKLFHALNMNDLASVTDSIETIAGQAPLLLAYFLSVRVFSEEVFFRGLLVDRIGVLPSTCLFALAHVFYYSFAEVVGAFFLGLILALWFKKTRSLLPVVAAHTLYNLFAILFIL
jgi:membrane protease YdiL (CAAX protease family)